MDRREFITTATVAGASMLVCGAACAQEAAKAAEKGDARKSCASKELNETQCTCANKTCPNHGICCLCVFNHRAQKNKPACLR
ncbi:MAG: hypothetical protein A2X49_06710 [Lentisphaerae bacterium GWF2_52_8]|nr:MAG: hypothetical protein A2X49_06710 [Lentisphaerae bacterium GWF2_52_8]